MYKDASGKRRFSFQRMVLNTIPNFASDTNPLTNDLSPQNHDDLFILQVGTTTPKSLNELSYYIVNVVDTEQISRRTHAMLHDIGVLSENGSKLDTTKISRKFTHQMAFLPSARQKKLVNMLFTWEEELMRWRLIEEEQAEINAVIDAEKDSNGEEARIGALEKRLKELEGLWMLRPSLRSSQARAADQLPDYSAEAPQGFMSGRRTSRQGSAAGLNQTNSRG